MTSAALVQAADDLLRRELSRPAVREAAYGSGWSSDLWAATAAAGWFDTLLPEEHGGLGLGTEAAAELFRLIGRRLIPGPYLDQLVVVPAVYPHVPERVRARLDRARAGAEVIVMADPESAGSNAANTVALERGTLTGQVEIVRFGAAAGGFLVVAQCGQCDVLAFVDASSPGVTVTARESFDPTSIVADLRLDQVPVSDDAVVSLGAADAIPIDRLRAGMRLMVAAELAGLSRYLLEASTEYAKSRTQFHRPIGSFAPVQQILGEMATQVLGLEAFVADCVSGCAPDPLDAVLLKGFASHVARGVGESLLQIHGGIAFTAEFEGNRWFLRALTLQGTYGDDVTAFAHAGRALLTGEWGARLRTSTTSSQAHAE